jgi:hypothetical protein
MALATKRAMAMDREGNGDNGKSDGDSNKEGMGKGGKSDGYSNEESNGDGGKIYGNSNKEGEGEDEGKNSMRIGNGN